MRTKTPESLYILLSILAAPFFFLTLHVAIAPTGQLSFGFTSRSILFAAIGLAFSVLPFVMTITLFFLRKKQICFAEHLQNLYTPLLLLYAYPLATLLHPLGIPRPIFILFQPRIILFIAICLLTLRFGEQALSKYTAIIQRRLSGISARRLAGLLFLTFCAAYAIMIHQNDRVHRLVGDEPHYLMIMESLRRYGTADLLPLVESEEPLPHGIRIVNLHTSGQTRPGTRYEVHNVGTAIAMLPAFQIFGYRGALSVFAIFSAFLLSNLFLLCEDITQKRLLSLVTVLIVGCSAPFLFYFRFIYPEIPAAACALFAFRIARKQSATLTMLILAGTAAAAMPWFHAKFTLLAATLMLFVLFLHRTSWKRIVAFAAPLVPSALLLMAFFYHAYGSWLPNAQYGSEYKTVNAFFFRGSLGLLMDPDNGLLPFAPLYILAAPGIWLLWKKHRTYCLQMLAFTLPSFVIVSSHWMWWGGPCPPARFIIPFIPFLVPGIVCTYSKAARKPYMMHLCLFLTIATLAISYVSFGHVDHLHAPRNFLRNQFLSLDAYFPFPSFYIHRSQPVPNDRFILAGIWILLFAAFTISLTSIKKCAHVKPYAPLGAFLIFLTLPGGTALLSEAFAGRETVPGDHAPITLTKMNHVLDAYYRPIMRRRNLHRHRSSISPIEIKVEIPIETEFDLATELFAPGHPDRWLYFGQYTTFYPARYEVILHMHANPIEPATPSVYFDVVSNKGRIQHIQNKIQADKSLAQNTFRFQPQDIMLGSEFRIAALQPGKYKLQSMQINLLVD